MGLLLRRLLLSRPFREMEDTRASCQVADALVVDPHTAPLRVQIVM